MRTKYHTLDIYSRRIVFNTVNLDKMYTWSENILGISGFKASIICSAFHIIFVICSE